MTSLNILYENFSTEKLVWELNTSMSFINFRHCFHARTVKIKNATNYNSS